MVQIKVLTTRVKNVCKLRYDWHYKRKFAFEKNTINFFFTYINFTKIIEH